VLAFVGLLAAALVQVLRRQRRATLTAAGAEA